jgi:hypothetical protein
MQGFSIESKISGISSSSTLWQDLKARYKSSNELNISPLARAAGFFFGINMLLLYLKLSRQN